MTRIARLLVGGLALAVLATLALALGGRTAPARASLADGDVTLGKVAITSCTPGANENCETQATGVYNVTAGDYGFEAGATGNGIALFGGSQTGTGVWGSSNGTGVYGNSILGTGIEGLSVDSNGIWGHTENAFSSGVYGENLSGGYGVAGRSTAPAGSSGAAVWGENTEDGVGVKGSTIHGGIGVYAVGSPLGTALYAYSPGSGSTAVLARSGFGTALSVDGVAMFTRSGMATVASGRKAIKVGGLTLAATSFVLATIQGNVPGIYVQGVTVILGSPGSFTIHLNASAPADLVIGWFVLG